MTILDPMIAGNCQNEVCGAQHAQQRARGARKAEVIAMMKRAKGASLAEIMEATHRALGCWVKSNSPDTRPAAHSHWAVIETNVLAAAIRPSCRNRVCSLRSMIARARSPLLRAPCFRPLADHARVTSNRESISGPEVGFEEGLLRRMATQPRVPRSPFLDSILLNYKGRRPPRLHRSGVAQGVAQRGRSVCSA